MRCCKAAHVTYLRKHSPGQMTVEFVVAFPVLLVVALISVNAMLFFSECASFDRAFRNITCTYATSPGYNQTQEQTTALIQSSIDEVFDREYLEVTVTSSGVFGGLSTFRGELKFSPTLFGAGNLSSAFGVSFFQLTHSATLTVDAYKPGVLL